MSPPSWFLSLYSYTEGFQLEAVLSPMGHWARCGDIFGSHNCGGGGTRDATKHPTMYRKAPITKNYPAQNVSSTDIEETLSYPKLPPSIKHIKSIHRKKIF